jgi:hypothetical protein
MFWSMLNPKVWYFGSTLGPIASSLASISTLRVSGVASAVRNEISTELVRAESS